MSSETRQKTKFPFYQDVNGFRIPGMFSRDAYLSALSYKPRPDDVFIVTYPKCGTTWVQNIVGSIYRRGKPMGSALDFFNQTPFLELTGADGAVKMTRPGAIKLHLPFHLAPFSPEAKYIFVARNPKDCCVSFYHHTKNLPGYYFDGDFDDYFELFINGEVDFGDYFDTLLSWYEHRNDPNVMFITYEEIKKDTKNSILKLAQFLGETYKELLENDSELMETVIYQSSVKYMQDVFHKNFEELSKMPKELIINNPDIPDGLREVFGTQELFEKDKSKINFIRKGIIGDWKNHFSQDQNSRLEKKYFERTKDTDISKLWENDM